LGLTWGERWVLLVALLMLPVVGVMLRWFSVAGTRRVLGSVNGKGQLPEI